MEMDLGGNEQTRYIQSETNDAIVSRLAQQDKVPWYSKPNLRALYFLMVPTCLGVEMTGGQVPHCDVWSLVKCLHERRFDASMVSGLQAVPLWLQCRVFASSMSDMVDLDNRLPSSSRRIGSHDFHLCSGFCCCTAVCPFCCR